MSQKTIDHLIDLAFREDLGEIGDITSILTIPEDKIINFTISNRQDMVLCGIDLAIKTFHISSKNRNLEINKHFNDGDYLTKNSTIVSGKGNARAIFAAERVALNFMQHLSGISTQTKKFIDQTCNDVKILDTRKTIPALRELQKYAVKTGGGKNHRMALFDGILIKDNHIAAAGSIKNAVSNIRSNLGNKMQIEVECDTLEQVKESIEAKADIIMLDNMNIRQIKNAVKIINKKAKIEVSGGVRLSKIKSLSLTGIDFISVGSLTHSVKAIDIGLDINE